MLAAGLLVAVVALVVVLAAWLYRYPEPRQDAGGRDLERELGGATEAGETDGPALTDWAPAADLITRLTAPTSQQAHLFVKNLGPGHASAVRVRFGAALDARPASDSWQGVAAQAHQIAAGQSRMVPLTLPPGSSRLFQVVLSWVDDAGVHEVTEVIDAQPPPPPMRRSRPVYRITR